MLVQCRGADNGVCHDHGDFQCATPIMRWGKKIRRTALSPDPLLGDDDDDDDDKGCEIPICWDPVSKLLTSRARIR